MFFNPTGTPLLRFRSIGVEKSETFSVFNVSYEAIIASFKALSDVT